MVSLSNHDLVCAAALTLILVACGRSDIPTPSSLAFQPDSFAARPDTLHVVPLFDFPGGAGGGNKKEKAGDIGQGGTGGLIGDPSKALYGVTSYGGDKSCGEGSGSGCGIVFELTPRPGYRLYKETILHTFEGPDGAAPFASLVMGADGNLYGTTAYGGAHDLGTVFSVSLSTSKNIETVLYSFKGRRYDGAVPRAPLFIDKSGAIYGTASQGGGICHFVAIIKEQCGIVFKLTPSSSGYTETIVHRFSGKKDGYTPLAGLIADSAGALYGTTEYGGNTGCSSFVNGGCGTVFKLTASGSKYSEQIIHRFQPGPRDGHWPEAGLAMGSGGVLYGTTVSGGSTQCPYMPPGGSYTYGCGTVFELTPSGSIYTKKLLHAFTETDTSDGLVPQTSLAIGPDGTLYGTTLAGGEKDSCGIIFQVAPLHSAFKTLHRFHGADGCQPSAPLLYDNNFVYGETLGGGQRGRGTIFKLPI